MAQKKMAQGSSYHIRLKGILNRSFADRFGGIAILSQENGKTLLVGQFADQPALRGFLDQLWNLNFTVLSVEQIETENGQNSND